MAVMLASRHVSPNIISVTSVVFGIAACATLMMTSCTDGLWIRISWVASAVLIQLRLLANMLDGMVAIESNLCSTIGDLFNEVPDRISDSVILIGAGYAVGGSPALGFVAAIIALFVAYTRAIGASVGAGQAFHGPLAKPHRMFILTLACLYCGVCPKAWQPIVAESGFGITAGALLLIIVGGIVTALRRLIFITSTIRAQDS